MINGNLVIRPLSAKLIHDTEHIGKMSPYVRITVGHDTKSSPPAKGQHLNPNWDCELTFRLNNQEIIYFELFHKETFLKDDLIGSGSLNVSNFLNKGLFSEWVPIMFKDKAAGEVLLEIQFFPDGGSLGMQKGGMGSTQTTGMGMPLTTGSMGMNTGMTGTTGMSGMTTGLNTNNNMFK